MRQKVDRNPIVGDMRIIERFLFFPQILELKNGELEKRFWETSKIVQVYEEFVYPGEYGFEIDEDWIDRYWKEDHLSLESYKDEKEEHHFY